MFLMTAVDRVIGAASSTIADAPMPLRLRCKTILRLRLKNNPAFTTQEQTCLCGAKTKQYLRRKYKAPRSMAQEQGSVLE